LETKTTESSRFFYEDPAKVVIPEEEKKQIMKEIDEIIQTVPYNLHVALIKVAQLNQYSPLPIEKYYECIKPTFHLLRKADGTKYTTSSMNTVRAGMLSTRLFFKNDDGLFMLNLRNALTHLQSLQKRKVFNDTESKRVKADSSEKKEKSEKKDIKNYEDFSSRYNIEEETTTKKKVKTMLGKKKKNDNYYNEAQFKKIAGKYLKAYELFNNLLRISSSNRNISSKLELDLDFINSSNLSEENTNTYKIIGMLTFFRFFRPFLEKNFNSFRVQEKVIQKLAEFNNEVRYIEALHKSHEN
jgi:hypothetical protein